MTGGRIVRAFEKLLFAPVAPARPYLLIRGFLFLLAFDCWLGFAPRGAYHVGGFNVAHFAWLDAIQPTPTPAIYMTLVLGAGLLALTMALSRPSRIGMAVLCAAYSYAWLMSLVDNYQHHYLLSLLLFVLIFVPHRTATEVFGPLDRAPADKREARQTPEASAGRGRAFPAAWGYVLFGLSCAIVYFYTAVTKLSPRWRSGEPLRSMGRTEFYLGWERSWVAGGGSASELWAMLAAGAIAAQIVSCVGYVAATQRDRLRGRWFQLAVTLAMVAPLSFHLGTERLSLSIGWFSYYMVWIALVFFLPAPVLDGVGRALTVPGRWLAAAWRWWSAGQGDRPLATIALALVVAAGTIALWYFVDLPGALAAGALAGVGLVLVVVRAVRGGHHQAARLATVSTALAALLGWAAITQSHVRFDYYRTVAGAHRRQGRWEATLEGYVKANRYAPPGQDRKDREAEARRHVRSR
jgi:hypothetical protein